MAKPTDMTKFLKTIDKNKSVGRGFHDPSIWVSTGHYLLNYFISGRFDRGVPLGKFTMFAGETGCLPEYAEVTVMTNTYDEPVKTTVGDLRTRFYNNEEIRILTPDGYSKITKWYDKGLMTMATIKTDRVSTTCATDHMIQLSNDRWIAARDIRVGMTIKTRLGDEVVTHAIPLSEPETCYDFSVEHRNQRYYGDDIVSHNSGKSYICSGSLVRTCQEMGIMPVIIDTENAIDEEWLLALGVDTAEDKLMKFNLAKVNDVAKVLADFIAWYKDAFDALDKSEQPPFMFIIDSLGMTITDNEEKQFTAGDMKGDMGIKAKQLNSLVRNTVHMISEYNIGVVATNHVYASQDMFSPDDKISGGKLLEYGASIMVAMKKSKDKDGSQVKGIKSKCQLRKTRYGRPFITTDVLISFKEGVDPYSGLVDFFVELGLMKQGGAYVSYITKDGEELKDYKTRFKNEWLEQVMAEFDYDEYALKSNAIAERQMQEIEEGIEPTMISAATIGVEEDGDDE